MKRSLLETILETSQLSVVFQPIFQVKDGIHRIDSLEALVRGPKGTHFERADVLFDYVRRKGAEAAVDRTCISAIFNAVKELSPDVRINVNVHALTLGRNPNFADFLCSEAEKHHLELDRFTAEIVEHAPSYNVPGLLATITQLRNSGIRIALDDIGLGNSNYRMILDCRPDYFKIDSYFVRGVTDDPDRRAVVQSVVSLAHSMGGQVVAEGIDSKESLSTLERMQVELFQANLLCCPMSIESLKANGFPVSIGRPALATTQLNGEKVTKFVQDSQKSFSSGASQSI